MKRRTRRPSALLILPIAIAALLGAVVARVRRDRASDRAPADVGFMRAMHDALRRDLVRLEDEVGRVRGWPPPAPFIESWRELSERLVRHHAAEDDDLWPVLRQHLTDLDQQRAVDQMLEEHAFLSKRIEGVNRVLAGDGGDLAVAVNKLGRALRDHLEHEERGVLPLLERHLSRREWRAFLVTERRRTPLRDRPDFLGWVLEDADEADAAAVLAEIPPPGRLVARYLFVPRYEARRRALHSEEASSRAS
jgi:iron-sulfur cluster repair protein YtfE (RIC family)